MTLTPASMACAACGQPALRRGVAQKYCEACSAMRDRDRKREWARQNPQPQTPEHLARRRALREAKQDLGAAASRESAPSITDPPVQPEPVRLLRLTIPFTWRWSKNALWSYANRSGHVFLRREIRDLRDGLALRIKAASRDEKWFQGKIWIGLHVEKPEHKGDAVNLLDTICDAVKRGIGIDDRWFCVRYIDWSIVKRDPKIRIEISQEMSVDFQACSYCGLVLTLDHFNKASGRPLGVGRECKACRGRLRGAARAAHRKDESATGDGNRRDRTRGGDMTAQTPATDSKCDLCGEPKATDRFKGWTELHLACGCSINLCADHWDFHWAADHEAIETLHASHCPGAGKEDAHDVH